MSRTLRSALTAAQCLPGPSRPMLRPALARAAVSQAPMGSRSFSLLDALPMPKSWRRSAKPAEAETPATEQPAVETSKSLFEEAAAEVEAEKQTQKFDEHRYKSAFHKMSHRKLNMLSRQVSGLPVDEAVVQLAFGDKRAGRTWVKSTLALARDHAEAKGLARERLVVAESWVSKGPKVARIDIKGRGRMGIKHHPTARIHFVLKEGKSYEEKRMEERAKALRKVRSAGVVREDGKLRRKVVSGWAW